MCHPLSFLSLQFELVSKFKWASILNLSIIKSFVDLLALAVISFSLKTSLLFELLTEFLNFN